MLVPLDRLYTVSWFDPSGFRQKAGNARPSIATVGMDDTERIFILDCWAAYCGLDYALGKVFKAYEKWHPAAFGVDITGSLIKDILLKEQKERGVSVPWRFTSLHGPKLHFIETVLQPISARGQLFRPPELEVKELRSEWINFPTGMHRDSMDALAHAIDLLPRRPIELTRETSKTNFAHYLKNIGLSQDEIRARLAEIER